MKSAFAAFLLLSFLASATPVRAESKLRGDLPRAGNRPLEEIPGLDSVYDVLKTRDGVRLRTILTQPAGKTGRLPAFLFVQWLSCDTIELPASAQGGWSRMIRRVAQESGLVVLRTEKRGVGDSEGGPCSALDYLTELADHPEALAKLKASEFVDPNRIIIFGASIGGTYAPLVAEGQDVAGIVVWGAGARTWFERMLVFERNFRELSNVPAGALNAEMKQLSAFFLSYLIRKKTPQQISAENASLGAMWSKIVGTEKDLHYGRPVAFHQQAQEQDWSAAWGQVRGPVPVFFAEYDWYEDAASAQLIERIVKRDHPRHTRFVTIPKTDHRFDAYPRAEDAVKGENGRVNEDPVVREILSWLREVLANPARG